MNRPGKRRAGARPDPDDPEPGPARPLGSATDRSAPATDTTTLGGSMSSAGSITKVVFTTRLA